MIENNKFNPELDLGTVIVGLNVDINDMIETHSIPATAADVIFHDSRYSLCEYFGGRQE